MRQFRKRVQRSQESHRVFGLELQNLLQKARPRWELDDPQFLDDLFTHFIEGLRDTEQRQVSCDSWKQGTSLTDLFLAIEDFKRKRHLLSSTVLSGTSCVVESDSPCETDTEHAEGDEEVSAVFQKNTTKPYSKSYPKTNSKYRKTATITPAVNSSPPVVGKTANLVKELVLRLTDMLSGGQQKNPKPKFDKTTKKCYRCQEMGHFAARCTAVKPVQRPEESKTEN